MLDLNSLVEEANHLEPMPASVTRLAEIVRREESRLEDIVELIALDQGLTMSLLHAANSAAYGGPRRIAVVKDALFRLGAGATLSLAIGRRIRKQMSAAMPSYEIAEGELWRHSVASALAAELSLPFCRVPIPPEAYTAALLHDVGKLVLVRFLDEDTLRILRRARGEGELLSLQAEIEVLGVHHGELGELVVQRWNLPETISKPLAWHHTPCEEAGVTADVVHLADVVAKHIGAGRSSDAGPPMLDAGAAERLGITPEGMEKLCRETTEGFEAVMQRYAA
jgi:HD-like signal output (HDOD) protein